MRQGLAICRAIGRQRCAAPYFLALLAEAYGKAGQVEEGLSLLAEALADVDKSGERLLRGGAVSAERGTPAGAGKQGARIGERRAKRWRSKA